jgi:hypothetical protein
MIRGGTICFALTAILIFGSDTNGATVPTVLNFDDYNIGLPEVAIPAGYGGLNWPSNVGVYGVAEPPWNPQSPPNRVLFNLNTETGLAETQVSFIAGPKIFIGAYFAGRHYVYFNLYNGPTLVHTSSVLILGSPVIPDRPPFFLASGYAGPVDTVGIVGVRGQHTMDDFTFAPVVPEPSTILLSGLAAVALPGINRRRTSIRFRRCRSERKRFYTAGRDSFC